MVYKGSMYLLIALKVLIIFKLSSLINLKTEAKNKLLCTWLIKNNKDDQ